MKTKRASVLILALIIGVSSIMGAVLTVPVSVFALSAGGIHTTIASIILSLFLQTGVAPVNQTWINSLNSSYGYTIETAISEGLLTQTTEGLIDTGLSTAIEGASAYTDLGLADIFTTTAADGVVVASSGAGNIANIAINVGTLGTIGAFAGAAAVGVGLGVLANHLINKYGDQIKVGLGIDAGSNAVRFAKANPGGVVFTINFSGYTRYYCFYDSSSVVGVYKQNSNDISWKIQNLTEVGQRYRQLSTAAPESGGTVNNSLTGTRPSVNDIDRFTKLNSDEYNNIKDLINNGTIEKPKINSPDMIGSEGNLFYDNDNDTFPGIASQIPEGSDMKPIDMDDYQDFVDNANNNTANGDTGEEQGQTFNDFIDPYIVDGPTIPDQPIIPDQPVDVPVVPDRPVTPDQPTMPNKPGLTDQEIQDALNGVTTIDLRSIFPFCIPFDLYNILLIFDTGENRKAPHITFTFPFTDWVIDVDLAPFDPVAGILRLLELILFIIGLAVATRKLIGAGGG